MLSPSWNFPAQAEPSYEDSEPSRAGALQCLSWNRAGFFVWYSFFSSKLLFVGNKSGILRRKSIIYLQKIKARVKMQRKTRKNVYFWISELNFFLQAEWKRSRAEQSWAENCSAWAMAKNKRLILAAFFKGRYTRCIFYTIIYF